MLAKSTRTFLLRNRNAVACKLRQLIALRIHALHRSAHLLRRRRSKQASASLAAQNVEADFAHVA